MDRKARRVRDAKAFAASIEEQAATCDWTRLLYDVQQTPEPVRLELRRRVA